MTDQRLQEAAQLRLANQFEQAESLCKAVLADDTNNAEAMALLGICAIEGGQTELGLEWLDKAEAADSGIASLHLFRSIYWEGAGDITKAVSCARQASELAPNRFDVWGRLGDLSGQAGDFVQSASAFGKALELDGAHPAAAHVALRLAGASLETGDLEGAGAALDKAENAGLAGNHDVLKLRAALARHRGDWAAMGRFAEAWLAADPNDHEALSAHALALSQQGYYKKAANAFRAVVEADPSAENWAAQGRLILGARDLTRADGCFRKALVIDPKCAEAIFGLARIHTFAGRIEKAEKACRKTLALEPNNLEAYGQLCEVSGGRLDDAEMSQLEAAIDQAGLPSDQKAIGLFALGDAFHRRKQRGEAFALWQRANDTKKLQHTGTTASAYSRTGQTQRTDWLIANFQGDENASASSGGEGAIPIFIVGMPRSGTTLIEAAIAAHDDVLPGGELSAMPHIFESFMDWAKNNGWTGGPIPEDHLTAWRNLYRGQHREFGLEGARYVTDKQPSNFLAVGLIRQLFPDAPIIHIRRKPVETSFSIFRRNFSRQWPFAHDLDDIAHYYAEQARMCAHWDAIIEKRFTVIQYEDLVRDFEAKLRYVMARAGLSWSRKCLEFYKQGHNVMTFSAVQVRKPPSADHLDSTSAYREHLAGFDDTIASLGVDTVTGAWRGDAVDVPVDDASGGAPTRSLWSRLTGQ